MSKDSSYQGIVDEFRYLIETNEKYNHELIEDLEWMKKTAYQFKHQAQKSQINQQDLKLSEFKIKELRSEIKKKRIMNLSVNLSQMQSLTGTPRTADNFSGSKNKFANALRAARRTEQEQRSLSFHHGKKQSSFTNGHSIDTWVSPTGGPNEADFVDQGIQQFDINIAGDSMRQTQRPSTEAQNALFDNIQEQNHVTLQPQIEMLEGYVDSRGHSDVRPRTMNQAATMPDYYPKRRRNKNVSMA